MNNTVLFLQSEIHNYHISLIKELIDTYHYDVLVIYKDKNNQTPYQPPLYNNVEFIGKSFFKSFKEIIKYIGHRKIVFARTSGWKDRDYIKVAIFLKSNKIPVVACSDTQWRNELKQTLGTILFGKYIRNSFSHIMVAGPYQYEYARKLGFQKHQILFNNLSADTTVYKSSLNNDYERVILFVGRLDPVKGLPMLLDVWKSLDNKMGWQLHLIGSGSLMNKSSEHNIKYLGYMTNLEIAKIMTKSAFLILPSIKEPWGVVMHEATLSGLPIICSDSVGAIPLFLISGFNGYIFKSGNKDELKQILLKMMNLSNEELIKMRNNSRILGNRITSQISAASLVAVLS